MNIYNSQSCVISTHFIYAQLPAKVLREFRKKCENANVPYQFVLCKILSEFNGTVGKIEVKNKPVADVADIIFAPKKKAN